jgi:hypothetical protein
LQGVEVETPQERKAGAIAGAHAAADHLPVTYVYIPADASRPMEELTCTVKTRGDALLEELKLKFSSSNTNTVDLELLKQSHPTLLAAGGIADAAPAISNETLTHVAMQANIETFTLVHPVASNQYTAVNFYLDEAGMLKRLPMNKRAADFAMRAGFNPPPQFFGEIYVGRIQYPARVNLGLELAEMNPGAEWLQKAAKQNLEYQMERNAITGQKQEQPAPAGTDGKAKVEAGYEWTQTEEEIEIRVQLPETVTSKQIKVRFTPQSVQISSPVSLAIYLFEQVDVDSCTWTLEGNQTLVISMEKIESALWPRIVD